MNIHRQKKYNYKHMKNKGITKHKASQYIYVYAYEDLLKLLQVTLVAFASSSTDGGFIQHSMLLR